MPETTSTIDTAADVATLINVFTVDADRQQELVDKLVEITDQVMQHVPGFVSANIHASLDGTRVVNYAQWASKEAFEAMLDDPTAREHIGEISQMARSEPGLFDVRSVHHA